MDKIWISYSRSESVQYCFLYYFFQMCGIWAIECQEGKECSDTDIHLVILGSNDADRIQPYKENCVYLIRKGRISCLLEDRDDVVLFERENEWGSLERLLEKIFLDSYDLSIMKDLLSIFMKTQIWGAAWLYHELYTENTNLWDHYLKEVCENVKETLKKSNYSESWNHEYLKVYCKYMLCGVIQKNFFDRSLECDGILKECRQLSKENGWTPALCLLAARVSSLSYIQEKFALSYYRSMLRRQRESEILYEMGQIFENLYGEYENAIAYYKKAIKKNNQNYRAVYEYALYLEKEDEWIKALCFYELIRKTIKSVPEGKTITVKDIEYDYKALKRIYWIVRINIDSKSMLKVLERDVIDYHKNFIEKNILRNLIHVMFSGRAEVKEIDILDEISLKIFGR